MLLFYNIGVRLYYLGVFVASFFNAKAKRWIDGRKNLLEKIGHGVEEFNGETIWVHCASLGEFEMARPVIEGLKKSKPDVRIVLTFFSPSGYEIRKNYQLADYVFYLPLDTPPNADRFVEVVRPTMVIFVRYDLWYNHLKAAKDFGANLMLISAQFRPSQPYFKFFGGVGRKAIRLFDQIFLVDVDSDKLLKGIGVENTTVCGDTRYDRVMEIAKTSEPIPEVESFKSKGKLVVCGSTWPEDEKVLNECFGKFTDTKFVIAPHEVGEENLQRIERLLPNTIRLSKYEVSAAEVLIVDSIGKLSSVYQYADVAYVGGGFGLGLHNILGATAYGIPTLFGPNHNRFPDAKNLAEKSLAVCISDSVSAVSKMEDFLQNDHSQMRTDLIAFMKSRTGATNAILEYTNKC